MAMVKQILVYAIGLIVGNLAGKWAGTIVGDNMGFLDSIGGPSYISNEIMIPTNLIAVVEFIVIVVVLFAVVRLIDRLGFLK